MKNILKKSSVGLAAFALIFTFALNYAKAATTNSVLSSLITPASQEDSTTIDQRMTARKAKVQLSATDKTNIAAKCTLAQTALIDRKAKDTKAAAVRLEAYNELVKRLTFIVDNLSAQGNDASALLNAENYFVASINNYMNDAERYKVDMDDLVIMDCKADPVGFKATLEDARQSRTRLATDVSGVKDNLANLKKTLADQRQTLINGKKK